MIDILSMLAYCLLALQDVETVQISSPPPGETSMVEASSKHPEAGDVPRQKLSRDEKLRRKREWARTWRIQHPELKRERDRADRLKHLEQRKRSSRNRYQSRREQVLAYQRQYYRANKERIIAYNRTLSEKLKREQPERLKGWQRKTYQNAKQKLHAIRRTDEYRRKHRDYCKQWDSSHPEKRAAMNASWRKRHPNALKAYWIARKVPNGDGKIIRHFVRQLLSKPSFICYYCGERTATQHLHVDHIIPTAKGGLTTIDNLCAACRTCNQSKHSKRLDDWKELPQRFLSL